MLRNYLAAALRNLAHNRVYTIISVACLSVGLAATFLAAAYIDHLHSYNRWIAGYQHVHRVAMEYTLPGRAPIQSESTPQSAVPWVTANVTHVLDAARIVIGRVAVRRGDLEAVEQIAWADGNLFKVLPMPAYLGDLATALQQPDSVVLTRSLARKYFGTDQALGQALQFNREHPMIVTAILEDLPTNTELVEKDLGILTDSSNIGVIAASNAAASPMSSNANAWNAYSYIRVDGAATPAQLDTQLARFPPVGSIKVRLYVKPLDQLVYSRERLEVLHAMPLLAGLALLISCMNFVNLTTARSIRRSTEVGVRKAAGASRGHLIGQFMGETLILGTLSMAIALSLCELSLPIARDLLDVPLAFEYWRSPTLILAIVGITGVTALLSGFYPAVLLARLKPASILNGGKSKAGQTRGLRQALVVVQFAVLAALVTGVIVAQKQLDHLLQKSLRFDGEQMLMMISTCRQALVDELQKLPGVAGAACSESAPINLSINNSIARTPNDTRQSFEVVRIDSHFLDLYGLRLLAGRSFRPDVPQDVVIPSEAGRTWRIIINATAVRNFGFASPQAAIGQNAFPGQDSAWEIIGVVEDFRLGRFDQPMASTIYQAEPARDQLLSVKLRGERIPETLQRIDELWKTLGDPKPINRFFLSESIERMHRSIVRQRSIFSTFAVLAVSLAIVGMLGLASSAAEERRLEIGVRKAFGATVSDIVRLVLWRFVKLAALAGLLGCCLAVPLMSRWLQGFTDRIDLQAWMFLGTCVLIVGLAVLTVCGHALVMSRARPSEALR